MPASEIYIFPVDPIHTDEGPDIVGAGNVLTVRTPAALVVTQPPTVVVRTALYWNVFIAFCVLAMPNVAVV
jgi:hypothetical protein